MLCKVLRRGMYAFNDSLSQCFKIFYCFYCLEFHLSLTVLGSIQVTYGENIS